MTKRLIFTAAVLATILRGPAAFACSCVSSPVRTHFANATVVFVGTAVSVHSAEGSFVAAEFSVADLYKGPSNGHITVTTPSSEASCGIAFLPGQRYTVFAKGAQGKTPDASLCGGTSQDTKLLSAAGYVHPIARFGLETTAPSMATQNAGSAVRTMAIVLAFVLLTGAAGTFVFGRRRKLVKAEG